MSDRQRQIIAIGGGGFYRDPENLGLERYILEQTSSAGKRVAFVPTASAEPDSYLVSFYTAFCDSVAVLRIYRSLKGLRICEIISSTKM